MPLLKDSQFVADTWVRLADEAPAPASADVIVSFARLLREYEALSKRDGRLGVELANDQRPSVLDAFLPGLALIVLPFPKFADGRAYSQARQLRQHGFTGELRASGDVLPDQLSHMSEVGFDAFEVTERFSEDAWRSAAEHVKLGYQFTQQPLRQHIWQARHRPSARRAG